MSDLNDGMPHIPNKKCDFKPDNKSNNLFDVMKSISELKYEDSDNNRTKAAFNENLDKAIYYIMKAISN